MVVHARDFCLLRVIGCVQQAECLQTNHSRRQLIARLDCRHGNPSGRLVDPPARCDVCRSVTIDTYEPITSEAHPFLPIAVRVAAQRILGGRLGVQHPEPVTFGTAANGKRRKLAFAISATVLRKRSSRLRDRRRAAAVASRCGRSVA